MQKWEKERVRVIDRAIEIKGRTEFNRDKDKKRNWERKKEKDRKRKR